MGALRRAIAVAALLIGSTSVAAAGGDHIADMRLTGVIDQVNAAYIEEGISVAVSGGAAAILLEVDSPGGELSSLERIEKAILNAPIPVITWVSPAGGMAASAATFVVLAGDVAAMAPQTTLGSASVVGSGGEDLPETLARKITNELVADIRQLATEHGRNADWAESAVRDAANVGAADAIAMDPPVVDFVATDATSLFAAIDEGTRADGYRLTFHGAPLPTLGGLELRPLSMNIGQQLLHLLSDPNIAFILFTIGFYGILAELFHPNFVSGIAGAIAIVLAFIGSNSLPLNVGGLLLLLIGLGLFALEAFVTSYGLLTVGGVISFLLGAFALYTGVDGTQAIQVQLSPWLVAVPLVIAAGFLLLVVRGVIDVHRRGMPVPPTLALVGVGGLAQTAIAPTGVALAGGESWSARSRSASIERGSPVRVVGVEGLELIVEPEANSAPEERK